MPLIRAPWGDPPFFAPASREEHVQLISEAQGAWERSQLRALKRIEILVPVQPAANNIFIGQTTNVNTGNGPEEGYVWSLRLLSITLSGTGTLTVYKASNSGDTRRPIFYSGTGQPVQVATWSSDQARIRHSEGIYVVGSTTITFVYMAAWEVPAEREAELA